MKQLGACFVMLVGGAMIVVCGSSTVWYRVVVEETAAPLALAHSLSSSQSWPASWRW